MPISTAVGKRNILLRVRELSELYALKTVYDYIAQKTESSLNGRVFFCGSIDSERSREVLQNAPARRRLELPSLDAVVSCYSDIGGGGDLEIDSSILKNCVAPMSDSDKVDLKKKYGVELSGPVLVIGYASPSPDVIKVVQAASKHATVYLVGDGKQENYHLNPEAKARVHTIEKHGVLKDYYAMADVAINAHNLRHTSAPLHNFVEATEGGCLLMVPSSNTAQYGYKQLVTAGVIVECADLDDLAARAEYSLRNFDRDSNTRIVEARARHLTQSRDRYLPVIFSKIMGLIEEDIRILDSEDLEITLEEGRMRIMHPDSNWGQCYSPFAINLDRSKEHFALLHNILESYDSGIFESSKYLFPTEISEESLIINDRWKSFQYKQKIEYTPYPLYIPLK